MARSLFRYNNFVEYSGIFLLLGLVALVLLVLDRNTAIMQPLRDLIKGELARTYALVYTSNTEFSKGFTALHTRQKMLSRITRLEQEREELLVRQRLDLPQLEKENKQLRDLLNLTDVYSEGIVVGEQIRAVGGNNTGKLFINVGANHQVRLSQPVLSAMGLVGQIEELYDGYSQVLPITHEDHALSVQVQDKSERFIARGDGEELVIQGLPERANIRSGDNLVSSGLGGIYPQLYPVGVVARIERKKSGLKDVYITPHTDFAELKFVVVMYQRRFSLQVP